MSSEVYRKINKLDLNKSNYLETILTGEHAGEKGLFVEEKLCWTDSKTDFFEQRELTGDEYEKNQIYVRDGQQYELSGGNHHLARGQNENQEELGCTP